MSSVHWLLSSPYTELERREGEKVESLRRQSVIAVTYCSGVNGRQGPLANSSLMTRVRVRRMKKWRQCNTLHGSQ